MKKLRGNPCSRFAFIVLRAMVVAGKPVHAHDLAASTRLDMRTINDQLRALRDAGATESVDSVQLFRWGSKTTVYKAVVIDLAADINQQH